MSNEKRSADMAAYGKPTTSLNYPLFEINLDEKTGRMKEPEDSSFLYSSPTLASYQRQLASLYQDRIIRETDLLSVGYGSINPQDTYKPTSVFAVRWETVPNTKILTMLGNIKVATTDKMLWSDDAEAKDALTQIGDLIYTPSEYAKVLMQDEMIGKIQFTAGGIYSTAILDDLRRKTRAESIALKARRAIENAGGDDIAQEAAENDALRDALNQPPTQKDMVTHENIYVTTWKRSETTNSDGEDVFGLTKSEDPALGDLEQDRGIGRSDPIQLGAGGAATVRDDVSFGPGMVWVSEDSNNIVNPLENTVMVKRIVSKSWEEDFIGPLSSSFAGTQLTPNTTLGITTTVVNTLKDSHSSVPVSLRNTFERQAYYDDYVRYMVDPRTKQELLSESFLSGLSWSITKLKKILGATRLPYEPLVAGDSLDVYDRTPKEKNDKVTPKRITPSRTWIRLVTEQLEQTTIEKQQIDPLQYAKEYKLLNTLVEGSKVLTVAQNFLIRFTDHGETVESAASQSQSSASSTSRLSLYSEILPFPVTYEKTKKVKSNNGRRSTKLLQVQKEGRLEQVVGSRLYTNVREWMHDQVLYYELDNSFTGKRSSEDMLEDGVSLHPIHEAFELIPSDNPIRTANQRYGTPFTTKMVGLSPRFSRNNSCLNNTTLKSLMNQCFEGNVLLSKEFDARFEITLDGLFSAYETKRLQVIEQLPIIITIPKNVGDAGAMENKVRVKHTEIELIGLMYAFLNDVLVAWFSQIEAWGVVNGMMETTFYYNNTSNQADIDIPDYWTSVKSSGITDSSPEDSMVTMGVVGLSSWYTAAQLGFTMLDPTPPPRTTIHRSKRTKVREILFDKWLNDRSANDGKDRQDSALIVSFVLSEFKFLFRTTLAHLTANSKDAQPQSSTEWMFRNLRMRSSLLPSDNLNSTAFDRWLLSLDGLKMTVQGKDEVQLYALLGRMSFMDKYARNTPSQANDLSNSSNRPKESQAEYIPVNGAMLLKIAKTMKTDPLVINGKSSHVVGQPITSKDVRVRGLGWNVAFKSWIPFTIELPPFIHPITRGVVDGILPTRPRSTLSSIKTTPREPSTRIHFQSPSEFTFLIGSPSKDHNARNYSNEYALLAGWNVELAVAPFPLKNSEVVLVGESYLKTLYAQLVELELFHYNRILDSSSSSISINSVGNEVILLYPTRLDQVLKLQIAYAKRVVKTALRYRISNVVNMNNNDSDTFIDLDHGQSTLPIDLDADESLDANYVLEWHRGTEYDGPVSYVAREDLLFSGYNPNRSLLVDSEGANYGDYTLWLVLDDPQRGSSQYVMATEPGVPLPERKDIGINDWNAAADSITRYLATRMDLADQITLNDDILALGVPKVPSVSDDGNSRSYTDLDVYESIMKSANTNPFKMEMGGGDQQSRPSYPSTFPMGISGENRNFITADMTSVPRYLIFRVCTVTISKSQILPAIHPGRSPKTKVKGVVADIWVSTETTGDGDDNGEKLVVRSANDRDPYDNGDTASLVKDTTSTLTECRKYDDLMNEFCVNSDWLQGFVKHPHLGLGDNRSESGALQKWLLQPSQTQLHALTFSQNTIKSYLLSRGHISNIPTFMKATRLSFEGYIYSTALAYFRRPAVLFGSSPSFTRAINGGSKTPMERYLTPITDVMTKLILINGLKGPTFETKKNNLQTFISDRVVPLSVVVTRNDINRLWDNTISRVCRTAMYYASITLSKTFGSDYDGDNVNSKSHLAEEYGILGGENSLYNFPNNRNALYYRWWLAKILSMDEKTKGREVVKMLHNALNDILFASTEYIPSYQRSGGSGVRRKAYELVITVTHGENKNTPGFSSQRRQFTERHLLNVLWDIRQSFWHLMILGSLGAKSTTNTSEALGIDPRLASIGCTLTCQIDAITSDDNSNAQSTDAELTHHISKSRRQRRLYNLESFEPLLILNTQSVLRATAQALAEHLCYDVLNTLRYKRSTLSGGNGSVDQILLLTEIPALVLFKSLENVFRKSEQEQLQFITHFKLDSESGDVSLDPWTQVDKFELRASNNLANGVPMTWTERFGSFDGYKAALLVVLLRYQDSVGDMLDNNQFVETLRYQAENELKVSLLLTSFFDQYQREVSMGAVATNVAPSLTCNEWECEPLNTVTVAQLCHETFRKCGDLMRSMFTSAKAIIDSKTPLPPSQSPNSVWQDFWSKVEQHGGIKNPLDVHDVTFHQLYGAYTNNDDVDDNDSGTNLTNSTINSIWSALHNSNPYLKITTFYSTNSDNEDIDDYDTSDSDINSDNDDNSDDNGSEEEPYSISFAAKLTFESRSGTSNTAHGGLRRIYRTNHSETLGRVIYGDASSLKSFLTKHCTSIESVNPELQDGILRPAVRNFLTTANGESYYVNYSWTFSNTTATKIEMARLLFSLTTTTTTNFSAYKDLDGNTKIDMIPVILKMGARTKLFYEWVKKVYLEELANASSIENGSGISPPTDMTQKQLEYAARMDIFWKKSISHIMAHNTPTTQY